MPSPLFRTKPIDRILAEAEHCEGGLKKCLSAVDLTALGVGAIIGAGIFVLTGYAAATKAGPAIMLSYSFAGLACIFAALCYAEFAARLPVAGSAYTYAYTSLGELFAWIIGWDLILEYTLGAAAVAVGWSGYLAKMLEGFSLYLPGWLIQVNLLGHPVNVLAALILMGLSTLLAIGIKESSRFNAVIVGVKLCVVLFVIFAGLQWVQPANWSPFLPFGIHGVFAGAATVFFAYIGFDAVSTTAEEAQNPQRDLPIGIITSLVVCTLLYVAVSAVITGMVPYQLIDHKAPLAAAFGLHGWAMAQSLIAIGGVAGLTSVMLVLLLSQSRIYFAMSRDGLMAPWFSKIHPRFETPLNATLVTGLFVTSLAAFIPLDELAEMVSIGTLFAFVLVSASVLVLRYRSDASPWQGSLWVGLLAVGCFLGSFAASFGWSPLVLGLGVLLAFGAAVMLFRQPSINAPSTFRCPWVPLIPILGIAANIAMMTSLSPMTWTRLWVWLVLGLVLYFTYGRGHSKLKI